MKPAIKFWISAFLFFASVGLGYAQSATLKFDPAWRWTAPEDEKFSLAKSQLASSNPQKPMPQTWCYSDLAFFCKIEVKMEKAARFPIKFRLGDVQYVDQLEGKRQRY